MSYTVFCKSAAYPHTESKSKFILSEPVLFFRLRTTAVGADSVLGIVNTQYCIRTGNQFEIMPLLCQLFLGIAGSIEGKLLS